MKHFRLIALILSIGFIFSLTSCGYKMGSELNIALPKDKRKLFIVKIEDVSTEKGLSAKVQNALHDEFSRRNNIEWVQRSQAQALVYLDITRFSGDDITKGEYDITQKGIFTISISMTVRDALSGEVIWQTSASGTETYFSQQSSLLARTRAVDRAVQNLADRISHYSF